MSLRENTEFFLFASEASLAKKILVPTYATRAEIRKDPEQGFWINVWWNCGEISPLTSREMEQANEKLHADYDPADYDPRQYC